MRKTTNNRERLTVAPRTPEKIIPLTRPHTPEDRPPAELASANTFVTEVAAKAGD